MLFPYTYVAHKMENMQLFIDFIFYEVWCKAPTLGPFNLNQFDANKELKEIMEAFYYSDAKDADFFYSNVERIYASFSVLTPEQIQKFRQWYQGNNDIEKICANNTVIHLARYVDIAPHHKDLADQLGTFFKGLYSPSLLNLAVLRTKIGDIDEHFQAFVSINKENICPFCGISNLLGENNSKREAYDHYLPKALYPFNSINFHNLVPTCHHCNSSYKTSKDPAHTSKDSTSVTCRRAVFYPYQTTPYSIEIQIVLQHSDIDKLTPDDITLKFGPDELIDEINTWKDVYGIEERYKAKLCGENDGKYWLTQVLDECHGYDKQPAEILAQRAQQAQNRPYADCNFLRMPFLDACKKNGIFDNM